MTANPDGSDPKVIAPLGEASGGVWSSDGRLAYTNVYGTTVVVDGSSVQLPFAEVTSLSWSPDGTRFVVTAVESTKGKHGRHGSGPADDGLQRLRRRLALS
jgi:WD40 repeat protein